MHDLVAQQHRRSRKPRGCKADKAHLQQCQLRNILSKSSMLVVTTVDCRELFQ